MTINAGNSLIDAHLCAQKDKQLSLGIAVSGSAIDQVAFNDSAIFDLLPQGLGTGLAHRFAQRVQALKQSSFMLA